MHPDSWRPCRTWARRHHSPARGRLEFPEIRWLRPGGEVFTAGNGNGGPQYVRPQPESGSSDHYSLERIGLPAFQFIQDPRDYEARSVPTNQDVFERL